MMVIAEGNGMKCPWCMVENAAELVTCGNCGNALDGSGQDMRPPKRSQDDRWDAALESAKNSIESSKGAYIGQSRPRTPVEFNLAAKVLIAGLIVLVIAFLLTVYAVEKAESGATSFDDFEKISTALKWSGYLNGIGEIIVVAGLIGIAIGLYRNHLQSPLMMDQP